MRAEREGGLEGPVTRRGDYLWILTILLLAFGMRAAYLVHGQQLGLFETLFLDSDSYARTAARIASGAGVGEHPYLLSPLYPYLLAPFVGAEGDLGVRAVQWIQAILGVLTVGLIMVIARWTLGRRPALLAGFLGAVFGPMIFGDGTILVASAQTFFLTLALALLVLSDRLSPQVEAGTAPGFSARTPSSRTDLPLWTAAGLSLGLSAALRPTGLALAALTVLVVWAFTLPWLGSRVATRVSAVRTLGLLLGLALVVLPFTMRNVRYGGETVLLSANGGFNFWIGNSGEASGLFRPPPGYRQDTDIVGRQMAEQTAGRALTYREASDWWKDRALHDIGKDPLRWVRLLMDKAIYLGHPSEIGQMVHDFEWHKDLIPVLRFPVDSRLLFLLALLSPLALWLEGRRDEIRRLRWLYVWFGGYSLTICLFFVTSRHRLPVVPVLIVLASGTIASLWNLAVGPGGGGRRKATTLGIAVLLLGALSVALYDRPGAPYQLTYSPAVKLYHRGLVLSRQARFDEAVRLFQQSLDERDDFNARFELAGALSRLRRFDEAAEHLERSLALDPGSSQAWFNLGYLRQNELESPEGAREAYRNAIRLDPGDPKAYFMLGQLSFQLRDVAAAVDALGRFLSLEGPGSPRRREAERMLVGAQQLLELEVRRPPSASGKAQKRVP